MSYSATFAGPTYIIDAGALTGMARSLRASLAASGHVLGHAACLHAIAAGFDFRDPNAMTAAVGQHPLVVNAHLTVHEGSKQPRDVRMGPLAVAEQFARLARFELARRAGRPGAAPDGGGEGMAPIRIAGGGHLVTTRGHLDAALAAALALVPVQISDGGQMEALRFSPRFEFEDGRVVLAMTRDPILDVPPCYAASRTLSPDFFAERLGGYLRERRQLVPLPEVLRGAIDAAFGSLETGPLGADWAVVLTQLAAPGWVEATWPEPGSWSDDDLWPLPQDQTALQQLAGGMLACAANLSLLAVRRPDGPVVPMSALFGVSDHRLTLAVEPPVAPLPGPERARRGIPVETLEIPLLDGVVARFDAASEMEQAILCLWQDCATRSSFPGDWRQVAEVMENMLEDLELATGLVLGPMPPQLPGESEAHWLARHLAGADLTRATNPNIKVVIPDDGGDAIELYLVPRTVDVGVVMSRRNIWTTITPIEVEVPDTGLEDAHPPSL